MCRIIAALHLGQQRSRDIFNSKFLSLDNVFLLFISVKQGHFFLCQRTPGRSSPSSCVSCLTAFQLHGPSKHLYRFLCGDLTLMRSPLSLNLSTRTVMLSHREKFVTTIWVIGAHMVSDWDLWEVAEVEAQISQTSEWGSVIVTPIQGLYLSVQFYIPASLRFYLC